MEEMNIARFPRSVHGRIPNFVNSEATARKLADQKEFKQAKLSRLIQTPPEQNQILNAS